MSVLAAGFLLFGFVSWAEILVMTGIADSGSRRHASLSVLMGCQAVLLAGIGSLPEAWCPPGFRPFADGAPEPWSKLLAELSLYVLLALETAALLAAARAYALNREGVSAIGAAVFSTMAIIPPIASLWSWAVGDPAPALRMGTGGLLPSLLWCSVLAAGSFVNFRLRAARSKIAHPGSILVQTLLMSATFVASVRTAQDHDPIRVYAFVTASMSAGFGAAALARGEWRGAWRSGALGRAVLVSFLSAAATCSAMAASRLLPVEFAAVAKRTLQAFAGYAYEAHRSGSSPRPAEIAVVVAMAAFAAAFRMLV